MVKMFDEHFGFVVDNIWEGVYVYGLLLLTTLGFFLGCLKEKFQPKDKLDISEEV